MNEMNLSEGLPAIGGGEAMAARTGGGRTARPTPAAANAAQDRRALGMSQPEVRSAPANKLGASHAPAVSFAVSVSFAVIVAKYGTSLVTAEQLGELRTITAKLDAEQENIDAHSMTVLEKKAAKIAEDYAHDPKGNAEKLHDLRQLRCLQPHELSQIQYLAERRMAVIQEKELQPLALAITRKAIELLQPDADRIFTEQSDGYSEFELEPQPSVLVVELQRIIRGLEDLTKTLEAHPEYCPRSTDLLTAILKANP